MPISKETKQLNALLFQTSIQNALIAGQVSYADLTASYFRQEPSASWGRVVPFLRWVASQPWGPANITDFQHSSKSVLSIPIPSDKIPSFQSLTWLPIPDIKPNTLLCDLWASVSKSLNASSKRDKNESSITQEPTPQPQVEVDSSPKHKQVIQPRQGTLDIRERYSRCGWILLTDNPSFGSNPAKCARCGKVANVSLWGAPKLYTTCSCCPQETGRTYPSKRLLTFTKFLEENEIGYVSDYQLTPSARCDYFLPELKIGICFNTFEGHHRDPSRPGYTYRNYHQEVSQSFLDSGIKLYHFWDDCSDGFVLTVLAPHLKLPQTRHRAREVVLGRPHSATVHDFYRRYHHKSTSSKCKWHYALYSKTGSLLSCVSFSIKDGYLGNVERYCNWPFHSVTGGFRKMLKAFLTDHPEVTEMITYCDRDFSPDPHATVYARSGFHLEGDAGPQLTFYSVEDRGYGFSPNEVHSRQSCQKWRLVQLEPKLLAPPSLSGEDMASLMGLIPCYNSGNWRYSMSGDVIEKIRAGGFRP